MAETNLFAFTEASPGSRPAYISINRLSEHAIAVSVRSRGTEYAQTISLQPDQTRLLARALLNEVTK